MKILVNSNLLLNKIVYYQLAVEFVFYEKA